MKKLVISEDYITLTQFLKIEGYIGSGGEAKYFLAENEVFLNSELENRRGKKLYNQDVIAVDGKEYLIVNEN